LKKEEFLAVVENLICPICGQEKLEKPKVYYSVFNEMKHPDYVCGGCGTPAWKRPEVAIPVISPKPPSAPDEKKPEHKEPWWFKEFTEKEERRKSGKVLPLRRS
jgi:coenzyme F420-reducing hydrogenase gamma subunit